MGNICFALAVVYCFLLVVCNCDSSPVVQVSLLHRDGARQEAMLVDGELSWSECALTTSGMIMSQNLGRFLRQRYDSFLPTVYDSDEIIMQSSESGRCLQTAVGVWSTLFESTPNSSAPFIFHTPKEVDYVLDFYGALPSSAIRSPYFQNFFHQFNALAAESVNLTTLQSLFGSDICNPSNAMYCATYAQDVWQCRNSNQAFVDPRLDNMSSRLLQMQTKHNEYDFFNSTATPSGYRSVGSLGFPLAHRFLSEARRALDNSSTALLHQYSAHDNTVVGLALALGAISVGDGQVDHWVPRFTHTIGMDTFANGTVSFWWAAPQEKYSSGFEFPEEATPLIVQCLGTASPTPYYSSSCSLDDVHRFLEQSAAPSTSSPECYLDAVDGMKCSNEAPGDTSCASYRLACPAAACAFNPDSVLDRTSARCLSFGDSPSPETNLKIAGPAAVGAFISGIFIGFAINRLLVICYPHDHDCTVP